MSKVAIVYWSGTGNTEQMAQQVAEGAAQAGAEVSLFSSAEFGADQMDAFSAVAFGCPSMGSEQLEESEFDPMFQACRASFPARRSPCSAPMAGATANGCAIGKKAATATAPCWRPILLSATKHRTTRPTKIAGPWGKRLLKTTIPLSKVPSWGIPYMS